MSISQTRIYKQWICCATSQGLPFPQSGQRGSLGQVRVRGAEADHLKVLIDGVEANDPGSELNWGTVSTVGVNRVEVLNGPRSAVWGDQALAGVINLETLPKEDQSSVLIGGGTLGTTLVQLARERVSESSFNGLSVKHIQSDGENASFVGDEHDGFEQLSANFIGGRTMHSWDVRLNGRTNETLSQYDSSGFDTDRHIEVTRHLVGLRAEQDNGEFFKPTVLLNHSINETRNYANQERTNSNNSSRTHLMLSSTLLSNVIFRIIDRYREYAGIVSAARQFTLRRPQSKSRHLRLGIGSRKRHGIGFVRYSHFCPS